MKSSSDSPDKKWYAEGLRFDCTQCGNCCKSHGEYAFVYLMEADVQAISCYLEMTQEEFLAKHCQTVEGWITLRMDDPQCPFLGVDNRCGIYPVRPKQCSTWPFWTENLKREVWDGPVRDCCPGIDKGDLVEAAEAERIAAENDRWYGD